MDPAVEAANIPSDMHLYFLKAGMEVRGLQAVTASTASSFTCWMSSCKGRDPLWLASWR